MLKDALGNEIHVGDKVFYSRLTGSRGIDRTIEEVVRVTDKSVGMNLSPWTKEVSLTWASGSKLVNVTKLVRE